MNVVHEQIRTNHLLRDKRDPKTRGANMNYNSHILREVDFPSFSESQRRKNNVSQSVGRFKACH